MGPLLLKVEAVRVRFLSYSEEAVRQTSLSILPGVAERGAESAKEKALWELGWSLNACEIPGTLCQCLSRCGIGGTAD